MLEVEINGIKSYIPRGTKYEALAKIHQDGYEHRIILARRNGITKDLGRIVRGSGVIDFITTGDAAGHAAYERTLVFLLCAAADGLYPEIRLKAMYSVSHGLYFEVWDKGFEVGEAFVHSLKERMREMVESDEPIRKKGMYVNEAADYFRQKGMEDKVRLLHYRRTESIILYSIGEYADYTHGELAPSAGYAGFFDIRPYRTGFVLMYPTRDNPGKIAPFVPQEKLFDIFRDAEDWSSWLNLYDVSTINAAVSHGRIHELVLITEARQEKKIATIASRIKKDPEKKFVLIAGPSSSGKTSFSYRLSVQLEAVGLRPHIIAADDYFKNREDTPKNEQGEYDFEALSAMDLELFNHDMCELLKGSRIELPSFNFKQGHREYRGRTMQLGKRDILIIEGIHGLNEAMSYELPASNKFKIYISAMTQLNIDDHCRIRTTDGRLIRRMVRDARHRGMSAEETIKRWPAVRRGEEANIFPYQESADAMFNSHLLYEFSVLKPYAEQLLFRIMPEQPEYSEAGRLLKLLEYFISVDSTFIPSNSLLKEFIGGSCFPV